MADWIFMWSRLPLWHKSLSMGKWCQEKKMKALVITAFSVQLWGAMEAEITAIQRVKQNSEAVVCGVKQWASRSWRGLSRGEEKSHLRTVWCCGSRWRGETNECRQEPSQRESEHLLRGSSFSALQSSAWVFKPGKELLETRIPTINCSYLWDPLFMQNPKDSQRFSVLKMAATFGLKKQAV